jgi:hypothetical protein
VVKTFVIHAIKSLGCNQEKLLIQPTFYKLSIYQSVNIAYQFCVFVEQLRTENTLVANIDQKDRHMSQMQTGARRQSSPFLGFLL